MKKRIIASTMASVMALSTAATMLVASADVADFKNQSVSKKQLQDFLADKEVENLVNGGTDEYGTNAGENFLKAVEYAEGLLDDEKATSDDYTIAYLMVKAAYGELHQWTKEDLEVKLADYKSAYDTNNELNERGDEVYKEGWTEFEDAYDNAEDVLDSEDTLEITDAYDELVAAYGKLVKWPTKTKSEIGKARKAYEDLVKMEDKFQPWARGQVTGTGTKYDKETFAWGTLYAHVFSAEDNLTDAIKEFTDIKGLDETSDAQIVAAVNAMNDAVKILNGFDSTFENKRKESNIDDLLEQYHGNLVYEFNADLAATIATDFVSAAGGDIADVEFMKKNGVFATVADASSIDATDHDTKAVWWNVSRNDGKTVEASLEIRAKSSSNDIFYILSETKLPNGKNAIYEDSGVYFYDDIDVAKAAASTAGLPVANVKTLRKGKDSFMISDHIGVTSAEYIANAGISVTNPATESADVVALVTGDISTNVTALKTAATNASTKANSLTSDTSSGNDDKVTEAVKNGIVEKADALYDAVEALETAVTAVTDADAVTGADLDAIQTAYNAIAAKVTALTAAATAASGSLQTATLASLTTDVTTAQTTLDGNFGSGDGKFGKLVSDYKAAYAAEAAGAAGDSYIVANGVYDSADVQFTNQLKFDYDDDSTNDFSMVSYNSSFANGTDVTTASLGKALIMVDAFRLKDWSSVTELDNLTTFNESLDMTGTTVRADAWKLLYNYLKYALEDNFKADAGKTYGLKDVKDLIALADALDDETIKTSLFTASHDALIKDRAGAKEWVKLAEADDKKNKLVRYKDNVSVYNVVTAKAAADYDSTAMYKRLETSYKQLKNELAAFNYRFGDIIKNMKDIAVELDGKKFDDKTKESLTKQLNKTALALLNVEELNMSGSGASTLDGEDALFADDATWNRENRLYTYGKVFNGVATVWNTTSGAVSTKAQIDWDSASKTHDAMKKAYEKLLADYKKAVEDLNKPAEKVRDVNGDGEIDVNDAMALMGIIANTDKPDVKYDYNDSKEVDVNDVMDLLKYIANQ